MGNEGHTSSLLLGTCLVFDVTSKRTVHQFLSTAKRTNRNYGSAQGREPRVLLSERHPPRYTARGVEWQNCHKGNHVKNKTCHYEVSEFPRRSCFVYWLKMNTLLLVITSSFILLGGGYRDYQTRDIKNQETFSFRKEWLRTPVNRKSKGGNKQCSWRVLLDGPWQRFASFSIEDDEKESA